MGTRPPFLFRPETGRGRAGGLKLFYRRLPSAVNRCEGIGNNERLYRFTSCGDETDHNLIGYGHLSSLGSTGQLLTQPRSLPSFVAR